MILNDCLDCLAIKQPIRISEEVFQVERGRESDVASFIKTSVEAIGAFAENLDNGGTVDLGSVRDTVRGIRFLVVSLVAELASQEERLEEVLLDMEWLKSRANDVILCSGSKYDLADNVETIFRLDNEIHNVLLQEFADIDDPYIVCSGKTTVTIYTELSMHFRRLCELMILVYT